MIVSMRSDMIPQAVRALAKLYRNADAPCFGSAERMESAVKKRNFRAAFSSAGFILTQFQDGTCELRRFDGYAEDTPKFEKVFKMFHPGNHSIPLNTAEKE